MLEQLPRNSFKSIIEKINFLKQSAFLDKQFYKNNEPITFLLHDLECYFLNTTNFRIANQFWKLFVHSVLKILNERFLGHPVC